MSDATPQQAANTIREYVMGTYGKLPRGAALAALKVLEDAANEAERRIEVLEAMDMTATAEHMTGWYRSEKARADAAVARADTLTHWIKELRAHIMYTLCPECGLADPQRIGADCGTCAATANVLRMADVAALARLTNPQETQE